MTTKTIEVSTDCEKLVLGALLNSVENAKTGLKLVHDVDFFETKHKIILRAIQRVLAEKDVVDIYLVQHKLTSEGDLQEAGGVSYLLELAQGSGTSFHLEAYCEDLKKLTQKRQLISITNSLSNDLQEGVEPFKIIEKLKDKIGSIEKHQAHAESAFRYLLEPSNENDISSEIKNISPGMHVGYKIGDIDLKIPGGAITIIAGPTSHGKTTQLINFSLGALDHPDQQDKSVYFFSYEESRAAIVSLFLNTYIGEKLSANNRESIKGFFRYGDMRYLSSEGNPRHIFPIKKNEFFGNLITTGRLNIFYSEFSALELVAAIRFLKKNTSVGLICIDYMQLLKLGLSSFGGSRQEELKQVCLLLKDCAVETGLPILLAAQFNREVVCEADLSPTKIGEAGDIERVANMILGFWNRNFEGFTREGNKSKNGKVMPKEEAIYMEILKGRETGSGHFEVFDFEGNAGKLKQRSKETTSHHNNGYNLQDRKYDDNGNQIICKL